jgi:hypothetical protein
MILKMAAAIILAMMLVRLLDHVVHLLRGEPPPRGWWRRKT